MRERAIEVAGPRVVVARGPPRLAPRVGRGVEAVGDLAHAGRERDRRAVRAEEQVRPLALREVARRGAARGRELVAAPQARVGAGERRGQGGQVAGLRRDGRRDDERVRPLGRGRACVEIKSSTRLQCVRIRMF